MALRVGHRRACVSGSGKEAALPPPPPLRTGRARFPASGSSLLKRLSRDAACLVTPVLAMSLTVAVGMEQLQVVQVVCATPRSPDPVVQVPLPFLLHGLPAPTTAASLLPVQVRYLLASRQRPLHLPVQSLLKVSFPLRV